MGFLQQVITSQLERVKVSQKARPWQLLKDEWASSQGIQTPGQQFLKALSGPGMSLIAEIKRASPSRGVIAPSLSAQEQGQCYEQAGANAISVLTEEKYFQGSLADLAEVAANTHLPILRKDFIIDPYQIWEGALAGAAAVLLIARVLGNRLIDLVDECHKIGVAALVEVHSAEELEIALSSGAKIIGVNCRDLDTLTVKPAVHRNLSPLIPPGIITVAESGIRTREDVKALEELGYAAVLVGESLVTAANPTEQVGTLLGRSPV